MEKRNRLLLVDDHQHAREGIQDLLEDYSEFEIIGQAKNGAEAVELAGTLSPDLILMDIRMPVMDGLEATKIIKYKYPSIKIVIMTVSDDITDLFEAVKRGAQGYLLKNLNSSEWYSYLRAFAVDEAPMSQKMAFKILNEFTQEKVEEEKTPLSAREKEILQLVAQGKSNRMIAENLSISEHTVKSHLKNILGKLHLDNRVQLTSYAFNKGWIERN
ncbi:response regulator transcription factor [Fictibacillus sp. 7GRE50]|jgi:DNA-binding NarL/FixJ family response regulator|uniref:response regulator n=1 Tax=Fictibacillus TaxID=1329200 RepID=UPI0018CFA746|nr:response regulator transcription factor [Fictibacillus sp. 7GRE50]MBH0166871.1 response regulator transcription factor [Fictibacillus sp. 7GRE50]